MIYVLSKITIFIIYTFYSFISMYQYCWIVSWIL